MAIALLERPALAWTCLNTEIMLIRAMGDQTGSDLKEHTFINVRRVRLLSDLLSLLVLAVLRFTVVQGLLSPNSNAAERPPAGGWPMSR
jgi:hypothetical protein